jgi:type IV secretion system protein VirB4
MAYLFHRVEALVDGRRLVVAIDEFWKALADAEFRDMVNDRLKTIRKRNGALILATQSPRDALNSPIAHSIIVLTEPEFRMVREAGHRERGVRPRPLRRAGLHRGSVRPRAHRAADGGDHRR